MLANAGASPRDSHRTWAWFFVIQGWTVDPGEDRLRKNAKKKKNERVTERKLGGCQTYCKFLHSV